MIKNNDIKFKLKIDPNNQWFVYAWVTMGGKKSRVEFKVDTGCNSLVISHRTLKNLGYSTKESDLSKLPGITGALASAPVMPGNFDKSDSLVEYPKFFNVL